VKKDVLQTPLLPSHFLPLVTNSCRNLTLPTVLESIAEQIPNLHLNSDINNSMATEADYHNFGAWAKMLNPDANIDRHTCQRIVPMEVLSLGCPRTGTLSMQEAYSMLGYAYPYHFSSVFDNIQDADMWQEAFNAKFRGGPALDWRKHFDSLLGHSSVVADAPAVLFWKELVEAYPDAKVVLVERDIEKWLPSCETLLVGILNPVAGYVLRYTDPTWTGRWNGLGRSWVEALFGSTSLATAKANAVGRYEAHYAAIRATVPADRLLEYKLGSGWQPLCKFLGRPEPDAPFPHRNEASTLERAFVRAIQKSLMRSARNVGVVVGGLAIMVGSVRSNWIPFIR
jgi:hypothetical protein